MNYAFIILSLVFVSSYLIHKRKSVSRNLPLWCEADVYSERPYERARYAASCVRKKKERKNHYEKKASWKKENRANEQESYLWSVEKKNEHIFPLQYFTTYDSSCNRSPFVLFFAGITRLTQSPFPSDNPYRSEEVTTRAAEFYPALVPDLRIEAGVTCNSRAPNSARAFSLHCMYTYHRAPSKTLRHSSPFLIRQATLTSVHSHPSWRPKPVRGGGNGGHIVSKFNAIAFSFLRCPIEQRMEIGTVTWKSRRAEYFFSGPFSSRNKTVRLTYCQEGSRNQSCFLGTFTIAKINVQLYRQITSWIFSSDLQRK